MSKDTMKEKWKKIQKLVVYNSFPITNRSTQSNSPQKLRMDAPIKQRTLEINN